MFGLLTYKKITLDEYNQFRRNYCGTCKTIGKLYGQKERFFLNFDTVFLSELLDAISNDINSFKYIKVNTCFSLPKADSQIPFFLKYTASVNILLAYYKIIDNIIDSRFKLNIWRVFRIAEINNFKKAKLFLKEAGVPIKIIEDNIKKQFSIEKQRDNLPNYKATIKHYCNPTGVITGEIFKASVKNLNFSNLQHAFSVIGKNFGEIVYLIDAIEDYMQDKKNEKFNCLLLDTKLPVENKVNIIIEYIKEAFEQLKFQIYNLPIQSNLKVSFCDRIYNNIENRLNKSNRNNFNCLRKKLTIRERYYSALEFANKRYLTIPRKNPSKFLYPITTLALIFLFVLIPTFAHAQVQRAECCGPWCCPCTGDEGGRQTGKKACECATDCNNSKCAPTCCSLISVGLFCGWCCGGSGAGGCGGSGAGEGPKVITITKVIEVDKGCGGCK